MITFNKSLKNILRGNTDNTTWEDDNTSESILTTDMVDRDYAGVKNIILPSTITKIDDFAFSDNLDIESIVIPDSVTVIGEFAFSNCSNLKTVKINGHNLKSILQLAFEDCINLKTINIDESVDVWDDAFEGTSI